MTKILSWPVALLHRLRGEVISENGWRDTLLELGSALESLGNSTEGEFLSIGENLQGFYQRAEEISKIAASVAGLMSGEELGAVIEGFRNVIEKMKRLEGESRRNTRTLREVLENLAHLNHEVEGFHKTILNLRVLCVSTRIESARLEDGDAGFEALADEVGKLSLEIANLCFQLLASSESLSRLIGQTLSRVLDLEATQQTRAGIVVDKTMSSLESIVEKHGLSAEAAGQVCARYEAISQRIGEIVSSMQFHDITRQRIEHAQQALAGLGPHDRLTGEHIGFPFGWNSRRMRLKGREEHRLLAADVSGLQIAQLDHAREELVSAVNNILDNLLALANLVEEMAQETSKMAGAADETGQSFLTGVEAGFCSVTSNLKTYGETGHELCLAMGSVGGMLEEMSAHAGNMEKIGEKIKMIALNATVKACRIGEQGATLAVLAEAIHQLSVETRRRTENASEALRSITLASESLCTAVNADGTDQGGDLAFVGEELKTQLQTLQNVNQSIVSLLTRMNLDGCSLCEDIRKTVDEVGVHRRVDEVIGRVVSGLGEIVSFLQSKEAAESQADSAERMKILESAYTMQGERDVHYQAKPNGVIVNPLTTIEAENEAPESGANKADEEDLGDNVELF